eukprot:scaffold978_cov164-Amphora_coffeaeformis.AAC.1
MSRGQKKGRAALVNSFGQDILLWMKVEEEHIDRSQNVDARMEKIKMMRQNLVGFLFKLIKFVEDDSAGRRAKPVVLYWMDNISRYKTISQAEYQKTLLELGFAKDSIKRKNKMDLCKLVVYHFLSNQVIMSRAAKH